jgi:bifunctional DNA-binding transcriptional regulator/antitoxin component of YhaV-PrlF toxin-antitoxin module
MTERIEINRKQPLEMDKRGRVTIPSNIRAKHELDPESDEEVWVEVTIEYAEIKDSEKDGGDGSE